MFVRAFLRWCAVGWRRRGDSACSVVVDLPGVGAHYALPRDIALRRVGDEDEEPRALENPDQVLAAAGADDKGSNVTRLWPLRLASSNSSSLAEGGGSGTAWRVRVLMRARSFWLVSYLTRTSGGDESDWGLEIGTIEWSVLLKTASHNVLIVSFVSSLPWQI
jgi:hypothetical protein